MPVKWPMEWLQGSTTRQFKCLVSEKPDHGLFFNPELLKEYSSKSVEQKKDVRGSSYIQKIVDFREALYQRGQLYMEFLKGECSKTSSGGQPCTECKSGGGLVPR